MTHQSPIESKQQIPVMDIPLCNFKQPAFTNLTGVSFANFYVIGMWANGKGWVARCECGTYCIRQAKAINNPDNFRDSCIDCRVADLFQPELL